MNVLPCDIKMSVELKNCLHSCLERARLELHRNDISEIKRWLKEADRCIRDLDMLIKKKEENERLQQFIQTLQKDGIDLSKNLLEKVGTGK